MKKILFIFAVLFSHFFNVYGQKDKLDQLFTQYQDVEGVTSIKIAKPMFGMLKNLNIGDSELDQIKPLLSKIEGLKVLITENTENGASKTKLSKLNKEISSYLKNMNYSEIMAVKNGDSKIKFLSSEAKDGILDNMLLQIDSGEGENILVMLDGKLSMDDVNKIINSGESNTNFSTVTQNNLTAENNSYLNGENRNVADFSGIEVSSGVKLIYKQENTKSIKVFADADKLQNVITKVENGVLKVYVDNKGARNLKFKNLSVNVSSPVLKNVSASSGSIFTAINSVKSDQIAMESSSGAVFKGNFQADEANVKASSGSSMNIQINSEKIATKSSSGASINMEGNSSSGFFDVSSGAICKAENFKVNKAVIEATSGSNIDIYVIEKLNAAASSGGSIRYKGNPEIDSKIGKMSGGSLKPFN